MKHKIKVGKVQVENIANLTPRVYNTPKNHDKLTLGTTEYHYFNRVESSWNLHSDFFPLLSPMYPQNKSLEKRSYRCQFIKYSDPFPIIKKAKFVYKALSGSMWE